MKPNHDTSIESPLADAKITRFFTKIESIPAE